VTFLFSDIEGSTRLVQQLGEAFPALLERHHSLLRAAFDLDVGGGVEVATEGDSFFVVFKSARSAVAAAAAAQRSLAAERWPADVGSVRVRMGLHTGEGTRGGDNYIGVDVNRAARIAAAAHGGQVLLSKATAGLIEGSLPDGLETRDLGEYRLKDLDRPERLIQLIVAGLPDTFPPPRTLESASNLPTEMSSFVGRLRELDELVGLVGGSRLVTLVGPGGTGKTRLSLRAGELLRPDFPGGVFFVDLSTTGDPDLIPGAIAHAIGLREDARRPIRASLEDYLADGRVLLILDNFEQILGGAPLVADLLRAAPGLAVIATSREALHLRGEQEYPVPALAIPDVRRLPPLAELSEYDAVGLFVQRARAVRPAFELDDENAPAVSAICARLDGLPLAIELAAARVKLLAPSAILQRLEHRLSILTSVGRDLPERQRTLRGAIDWSYELLDPAERLWFARLAVFAGGCTIEDAQAVCDPDAELALDGLDALASLVDKSLVRQLPDAAGQPRFGMLETIREYAVERLSETGDGQATRRRHQDHFAALANRAQPELLGARQGEWLDRLEADRDNLRTAMQNAADDGRTDLALGIGAALWRFWQQRGHLAEGRAALEGLLALPTAAARTSARGSALAGLGGLRYWQGDLAAAGEAYAEALEIERGLDDPRGLAEALYDAGFVAAITGDRATARTDYEESLQIYRRLGDEAAVGRLSEALVFVMFHDGEFAAARVLQEENVRAFRATGEAFRIANGLNLLSAIQLKDGDLDAARASQAEAIGIFHAATDVPGVIRALLLAAVVAVADADADVKAVADADADTDADAAANAESERAARLCGAVDTLKEPLGQVATPMTMLHLEDPAVTARRLLGDEAFEQAFESGRRLTLDDAVALVRT
jgi:predicted ATPase/class 3 adenylate cyclase